MIVKDGRAGLFVREFHFQPEFDAAGADQRRGQVGDIHGGHHDTHPAGAPSIGPTIGERTPPNQPVPARLTIPASPGPGHQWRGGAGRVR